jgi:hypothetical protein
MSLQHTKSARVNPISRFGSTEGLCQLFSLFGPPEMGKIVIDGLDADVNRIPKPHLQQTIVAKTVVLARLVTFGWPTTRKAMSWL